MSVVASMSCTDGERAYPKKTPGGLGGLQIGQFWKPVPLIVTTVPPEIGPEDGATEVIVGADNAAVEISNVASASFFTA